MAYTSRVNQAPQRGAELGKVGTAALSRLAPHFEAVQGTQSYMTLARTKLFNMLKYSAPLLVKVPTWFFILLLQNSNGRKLGWPCILIASKRRSWHPPLSSAVAWYRRILTKSLPCSRSVWNCCESTSAHSPLGLPTTVSFCASGNYEAICT